jgi:hypothetical protein
MITIKEFPDKAFADKNEMFTAIKENKQALIAAKKMQTKFTDAIYFSPQVIVRGETIKAINPDEVDNIKVKVVINTTNLIDSHSDVHIDGIWNKSVKEKKNLYLIQEHQMKFTNIISDDVKASVEKTTFDALKVGLKGSTEALVFETTIQKNRNAFMFDQYAKGFVKNHSVGMRYVSMELALNSDVEHDKEEKAVWDKYIDRVANREEAEEKGYFWAVTEAKIIEGSAVPIGSNWATPTISTEAVSDTSKTEPPRGTQTNKVKFINLKN